MSDIKATIEGRLTLEFPDGTRVSKDIHSQGTITHNVPADRYRNTHMVQAVLLEVCRSAAWQAMKVVRIFANTLEAEHDRSEQEG